METRRFFIETWGCQMNDHDSEKVAGILCELGWRPAATIDEADLYLLNTCSVREKAQEKIFSRLGVLRPVKARRSAGMIIGVLGCVAQQEGERIFSRAPYVDLVLGPQNLGALPELLEKLDDGGGKQVSLTEDPANHLFSAARIRRGQGLKALVTITQGCDNFCSYCIVPYTRGRERSRPAADVLDEVKRAVDDGYQEIELLGQNVNAYRSDLDFAGLLGRIAQIGGVRMVRYVSPHPRDFDRRVLDVIARHDNISTHLHLPAQSGNSEVLKRMGRGYSRDRYLDQVSMIREVLGDWASLSSDFIVGFPGETEAAFEDTLTLIENVGYDHVFAFVYSPRPGTRALKLGDPIPLEAKQERLRRLNELQKEIQTQRLRQRIGERRLVLIDHIVSDARHPLRGRRRDDLVVHIEPPNSGVPQGEGSHWSCFFGRMVDVEIIGAGVHTLRGRISGTLETKPIEAG